MASAQITDMGRRIALAAITDPSLAPNPGPTTVMLVGAGHTFGLEYSYAIDVTDEVVATGYARALLTVASLTTEPDGRVTAQFSVTDFGLVGGAVDDTVQGCYLIADSGNDATSPVMHCVMFTSTPTTDGTQLRITWNPGGAASFVPMIA